MVIVVFPPKTQYLKFGNFYWIKPSILDFLEKWLVESRIFLLDRFTMRQWDQKSILRIRLQRSVDPVETGAVQLHWPSRSWRAKASGNSTDHLFSGCSMGQCGLTEAQTQSPAHAIHVTNEPNISQSSLYKLSALVNIEVTPSSHIFYFSVDRA